MTTRAAIKTERNEPDDFDCSNENKTVACVHVGFLYAFCWKSKSEKEEGYIHELSKQATLFMYVVIKGTLLVGQLFRKDRTLYKCTLFFKRKLVI